MEHFSSHPRKRFTARVFVHLDASLHNHSHPLTIMCVQITFSFNSTKCWRHDFLELAKSCRYCQEDDVTSCGDVESIIRQWYLQHVSADRLVRGWSPAWWLENTVSNLNTEHFREQSRGGEQRREEMRSEDWGLRSRSASRRQSGAGAGSDTDWCGLSQLLLTRGDGYKIILNMSPLLTLLHVRHNWSKTW